MYLMLCIFTPKKWLN